MAKTTKMTDQELVALLQSERSIISEGGYSEIAAQRVQSNYSFANLQTDRVIPTTNMSSTKFYFTSSVTNTLVHYQSKIFCSDKETVVFNPTRKDPASLEGAKQLQTMVNDTIHKHNDGYDIITNMFRSAAVNKNSIAKVVWEESPESFEESFENFDPIALETRISELEDEGYKVKKVKSNETIEIVSSEVLDPTTGEVLIIEEELTYGDYTIRAEKMKGQVVIDVIPPEEFLINEDTTKIDSPLTRFVAHRRTMYSGDVLKMFPKAKPEELFAGDDDEYEFEKRSRHNVDYTWEYDTNNSPRGDTTRVEVLESWVRADRNNDGFPEWRHTFSSGSHLLSDEEWFGPIPFTSYTFFEIPHKFYGLSVYDRLQDYEAAACGLVRSEIDMNLQKNTPRTLIKDGSVDIRNFIEGKTGYIPTSAGFDATTDLAVMPMPAGATNTIPLLVELRKQIIAEIGIDPVSGQVSTDIEKSGNDSAKTSMAIDNASVKLEGYARRFADGPLRDIIWLIAIELVKNADTEFVKNLVEAVTPGAPFIADEQGLYKMLNKSDLKAKVGLGHQTSTQKAQAAGVVSALIAQLAQSPSMAMYNITAEALRGHNYDNPEEILGSVEEWVQKGQEQSQQAAAAAQSQLVQAQTAQQALALQEKQVLGQLQIAQAESQAKLAREAAESQADIELTKAKTLKEMADARKQDIETQRLGQIPVASISGVL